MLKLLEDITLVENHVALVTTKTLSRLNLLNESLVKISINCNNTSKSISDKFQAVEDNKKSFVLRLKRLPHDLFQDIDFDDDSDDEHRHHHHHHNDGNEKDSVRSYEDNVLYISPGTLFNIANADRNIYHSLQQQQCEVNVAFLKSFDENYVKYFATTVDITPVSCSYGHISDDCLYGVIKDYFRQPKILQLNELFSIQLSEKYLKTKDHPCLLWFQVKSIEQSGDRISHMDTNAVFVDDDNSNLYLSNAVNCFTPVCSCFVQNNLQLIKLFQNSSFLEGFHKYSEKISPLFTVVFNKHIAAKQALLLLEGERGIGKGLLVRLLCFRQCVHYHEANCFDLIGDSLSATEKRLTNIFHLSKSSSPCVLYLKNVHLLCKDKEGLHEERRILQHFVNCLSEISRNDPVLVIGSTSCSKEISPRFFAEFIHHVRIELPDENERCCLIKAIMDGHIERFTSTSVQYDPQLPLLSKKDDNFHPNPLHFNSEELAKKTAGFIIADYIALLRNIRFRKCTDKSLVDNTFEHAIEEIRILKAGSSDTVKIPKVTWSDVGGLQKVKNDIMDTLELPLKFPTLFSNGIQRSGLLFYGPPGCGKTLLAKAIANEFTLNFYSVKGPELINMYVGQSEENVREVFNKARAMSPCVIFFDEIDSLAPNRGRSGDSGGVMDRIVSQLLAELDGMHDNTDIFVIAATNRPDLLDPSLLRPGRFDKLIYVGIPEDHAERLNIMKAVSRKLKLSSDVNLEEIVQHCPKNLTGADFYCLASQAAMNCFRRMISAHENEGIPICANDVEVSMADMMLAVKNLKPSVSVNELRRYQTLREEILSKNTK